MDNDIKYTIKWLQVRIPLLTKSQNIFWLKQAFEHFKQTIMNNKIETLPNNDFKVVYDTQNSTDYTTLHKKLDAATEALKRSSRHTAQVYLSKFKYSEAQKQILEEIAQNGCTTTPLEIVHETFDKLTTLYDYTNTEHQYVFLARPTRLESTWRKRDIMFFVL